MVILLNTSMKVLQIACLMKKIKAFLILLFFTAGYFVSAQSLTTDLPESQVKVAVDSGESVGTLTLPEANFKGPVVIIISGAGPTDRNGICILTQNNALQMLAYGLPDF